MISIYIIRFVFSKYYTKIIEQSCLLLGNSIAQFICFTIHFQVVF